MECVYCQGLILPNFQLNQWLSFRKVTISNLCLNCEQVLEQCLWSETGCQLCHRQIPFEQKYCSDCLFWLNQAPDYPLSINAIYHYRMIVKDLIHHYKTLGDLRVASIFEQPLKKICQKKAVDTIIIPLVSHPDREKWRGFNQVSWLLDQIQVDYLDVFLYQQETRNKQAHQNRHERLASTNPFYIKPSFKNKLYDQLKHRKVCLVDDIYTTGKTLHHAMDCLKPYHVKSFSAITLAH